LLVNLLTDELFILTDLSTSHMLRNIPCAVAYT